MRLPEDSAFDGGQVEMKSCALSYCTFQHDMTAGLLGNSVDSGQSQPGAFALSFGGKEGLEDVGSCIGIHSGAGVADRQANVGARLHSGIVICRLLLNGDIRSLQDQL